MKKMLFSILAVFMGIILYAKTDLFPNIISTFKNGISESSISSIIDTVDMFIQDKSNELSNVLQDK